MAAMRATGRHIFRRFSTGGKVLSEEEKAAENVYIKVITFPLLAVVWPRRCSLMRIFTIGIGSGSYF